MKYIKNILIYFQVLSISFQVAAHDLKSRVEIGDVILIPIKCYVCRAIELNTNSPYSHLGIIINEKKEVAHSLGRVKKESFVRFLSLKDSRRNLAIMRPLSLSIKDKQDLKNDFYKNYLGLPYDEQFLWNNYDDKGQEKLYCSEFITKLLNKFLIEQINTLPMDYSENIPFWSNYFNGDIPQGLPGVTPSTFFNHPSFFQIN